MSVPDSAFCPSGYLEVGVDEDYNWGAYWERMGGGIKDVGRVNCPGKEQVGQGI